MIPICRIGPEIGGRAGYRHTALDIPETSTTRMWQKGGGKEELPLAEDLLH